MKTIERQKAFGWPIAIDIFLGGTGGAVFFISFLLEQAHRYASLAQIGAVIGPVLVMLGVVILFFDLSVKTRAYGLLSNMSSWMARGTLFIILFTGCSLIYAVPGFWLQDWKTIPAIRIIGILAAIFSLLVGVYPGFMFSFIKRIPIWNRSALPVVFVSSSLCAGIAILLLISPFVTLEATNTMNFLTLLAIVLIAIQLYITIVFFMIVRQEGNKEAASASLLKKPLFIIGGIIIGLALSLVLFVYQGNTQGAPGIILAAILMLFCNLIFRYIILRSGLRLPLYPP
jgi:formate-dependent nitrite reductase membrane component NrfD